MEKEKGGRKRGLRRDSDSRVLTQTFLKQRGPTFGKKVAQDQRRGGTGKKRRILKKESLHKSFFCEEKRLNWKIVSIKNSLELFTGKSIKVDNGDRGKLHTYLQGKEGGVRDGGCYNLLSESNGQH